VNKWIGIGRLVKEVETFSGASQFAKFTIAVNRKFKKDGEPDADFFNIVAFGKTAEFCEKYFLKGKQVAISGRVQNRTWTDKEGAKRYSTDIVAEEVYFADSKGEAKPVQEEVASAVSVEDLGGSADENSPDDLPF